MIENITQDQFEEWLTRFGDDQRVGYAKHGILCPLARCLKALNPDWSFLVNHQFILVSEAHPDDVLTQQMTTLKTTPWQWELMVELDVDSTTGRTSNELTGRMVRKALEKIKSYQI